MTEYRLMGTENPRTGEAHTWITRDGTNVTLEEVVSDLLWLQEECEKLRLVIDSYSIIEASRRIGRQPPERCLDCVRDYWEPKTHTAAVAAGGGDG